VEIIILNKKDLNLVEGLAVLCLDVFIMQELDVVAVNNRGTREFPDKKGFGERGSSLIRRGSGNEGVP
jgi:hypothetical protein